VLRGAGKGVLAPVARGFARTGCALHGRVLWVHQQPGSRREAPLRRSAPAVAGCPDRVSKGKGARPNPAARGAVGRAGCHPPRRPAAPLYRLARGRNTGAVIPSRHPARCRSGPVGQQHGSRHCAAGDVRHLERNPQVLAAVGQRRYLHAHDHRHHHVCTVRGVTGIVRDNGRTEQLHCLARGQESFHL